MRTLALAARGVPPKQATAQPLGFISDSPSGRSAGFFQAIAAPPAGAPAAPPPPAGSAAPPPPPKRKPQDPPPPRHPAPHQEPPRLGRRPPAARLRAGPSTSRHAPGLHPIIR